MSILWIFLFRNLHDIRPHPWASERLIFPGLNYPNKLEFWDDGSSRAQPCKAAKSISWSLDWLTRKKNRLRSGDSSHALADTRVDLLWPEEICRVVTRYASCICL